MNVKDTYLIFFHTGKSQFVMDLQRFKNKFSIQYAKIKIV